MWDQVLRQADRLYAEQNPNGAVQLTDGSGFPESENFVQEVMRRGQALAGIQKPRDLVAERDALLKQRKDRELIERRNRLLEQVQEGRRQRAEAEKAPPPPVDLRQQELDALAAADEEFRKVQSGREVMHRMHGDIKRYQLDNPKYGSEY